MLVFYDNGKLTVNGYKSMLNIIFVDLSNFIWAVYSMQCRYKKLK